MGVQPPVESSICFSIVYAQKYCPSCVPVFMKFKNFVQENVKMCTLFSQCASVYWLCPWTQFGDFCSPDALAPTILDNSWSTSCETPPLWSPGYAYGATIPISIPCGSPDTGVMWGHLMLDILLVMLFAKNNVMNFSSKWHQCHQNCCLNKPYFMLKMHQIHNSVHRFHISLAVTHTERKYGSNSTWLDSTQLDTFDVSSPCILAVSS